MRYVFTIIITLATIGFCLAGHPYMGISFIVGWGIGLFIGMLEEA